MRYRLWTVLIACALAYAALLPARGVWAPDEARYAAVTQEMQQAGSWVIPRLNGSLYTEKPPLFFILSRLFACISGKVHPWAVKLPSLLAALGTLTLLGILGERLIGGAGGWLAALMLGTTFKFAWQAQFGQIDMLVAFLITAQIFVGLWTGKGWLSRRTGIAGLSILSVLGILAKGPAACLPAWLTLAVFFLLSRDREGLNRAGIHWALLWTAALSAGWLASIGLLAGWKYPQTLLLHQTLGRYFEAWHHKAPWYYYLKVIWTDGLPWIIFLPLMAVSLTRSKQWREPAVLLGLSWLVSYLGFFSLSAGKRSVYIFPVLAAVALLAAFGAARYFSDLREKRTLAWGYPVLFLLFCAIAAALFYKVPLDERELAWRLLPALAVISAASLGAFALARGPLPAWSVVLLASAVLLFAVGAIPVLRGLNRLKTPGRLVNAIRPRIAAGGELGVYPNLVPSLNYYCKVETPVFPMSGQQQAINWLRSSPKRILAVQFKDFNGALPRGVAVLRKGDIGSNEYVLLEFHGRAGARQKRAAGG